jgi:hypothetical protein
MLIQTTGITEELFRRCVAHLLPAGWGIGNHTAAAKYNRTLQRSAPEDRMHQHLDQITAILTRTPAALNALLSDLPDLWTQRNEGGESFTVVDVVGHLIYADIADWMPRARMILEFGEARAFEPFDRRGHVRECAGKSLPQLLERFARLRREKLSELQHLHLTPKDLIRYGRHPVLGRVSLGELLATWAAHDLNHIHQISRVMAYQYREAVGPFRKYLGVMQCNGHSAAA